MKIKVGDTFSVKVAGYVSTYRREPDDLDPVFECERIQVTHLTSTMTPGMKPYTFGTEPEWFRQRGHEAVE
jgi:hypothetical protein